MSVLLGILCVWARNSKIPFRVHEKVLWRWLSALVYVVTLGGRRKARGEKSLRKWSRPSSPAAGACRGSVGGPRKAGRGLFLARAAALWSDQRRAGGEWGPRHHLFFRDTGLYLFGISITYPGLFPTPSSQLRLGLGEGGPMELFFSCFFFLVFFLLTPSWGLLL